MTTALLVYAALLPGGWPLDPADPRERRAAREAAVARVGEAARGLVETYGEPAVLAIRACPTEIGRRLAEFHTSGRLAKIPRPADLLTCIGQPGMGPEVAVWVMAHDQDLYDLAAFDAFLVSPLVYALNLKPLSQGAAEIRAQRLQALESRQGTAEIVLPAAMQNWRLWDWKLIALAGAGVVIALLLRRRRGGGNYLPAAR